MLYVVLLLHVIIIVSCLLCLCRLKQPEYTSFRVKAGAAKTLDDFEAIAAELKQLVLVRLLLQ